MKKILMLAISILAIILLTSLVFALSAKDCKKECSFAKRDSIYNSNAEFKLCKQNCNLTNYGKCVANCSNEKRIIIKRTNQEFSNCNEKCKYAGITCENGRYKGGEVFLEGCNRCVCGLNSKISCIKTDFCNYNAKINKSYCELNGGFFNQLCNGPYFDIFCSKDNYCICDGFNNNSCPSDFFCMHNFSISAGRKANTIPGWKDLLGKKLGDIGVCVKKPVLGSCGNGICENIMTNETDSETRHNCPVDC